MDTKTLTIIEEIMRVAMESRDFEMAEIARTALGEPCLEEGAPGTMLSRECALKICREMIEDFEAERAHYGPVGK